MAFTAGTSGNDTFNVSATDGSGTVDGGAGTDTLNLDWSTVTGVYFNSYSNASNSYYGNIYGTNNLGAGLGITFSNLEKTNLKTGSGDDYIGFAIGLEPCPAALRRVGGLQR